MKIIQGNNRNLIFYFFIIISIIYIVVAKQIGDDQDTKFLNDYQQYERVTVLANEQKYIGVEPILKDLVSKYKNSYVISWQYAICLDGLGNYQEADKYYAMAEKIRPFIVKNQYFLVQRGKVFYQLGNYSEAIKYLEYSKKINENSDLTKLADQLLTEINKKLTNK